MAMTIPVIPDLPSGYVVTAEDLNALGYAAQFMMTKPLTRVHDGTGGLALTTSNQAIPFPTKDIDTDGMWSSGANTKLTIQTPGWYKLRYSVVVTNGGTIATIVKSTTGANNPLGAGVVSSPFWTGYSVLHATTDISGAGAAGAWPFYLYAGDFLQVFALAAAAGPTTSNANGGSYFTLELVSI